MIAARRARGRLICMILALATPLLPAAGAAEPISAERQKELVQSALNAYDEAVAAGRESPDRAEQLYRQSAAAFDALVASGVRNAAIEYNLGNAHFRLKDLGRAVVHYRRAQQIDPSDTRVAANLAYVRQRVEPLIAASADSQLFARLSFWSHIVSREARFRIAAVASIAGWCGLFFWLRRRNRTVLALSVIAIVIGLANGASVATELRSESSAPAAVITRANAVLRQGRGENYDPVLRQPLGPGVEVVVLTERGDWSEVQLVNQQSGWLPTADLLQVTP